MLIILILNDPFKSKVKGRLWDYILISKGIFKKNYGLWKSCTSVKSVEKHFKDIVTIAIALGNNLDVRKIVMILLGILFIVSGNYMPKVRSDYYMNSKLFWVKNRDEKLVKKAIKISARVSIIFLIYLPIHIYKK